MDVTSKTNFIVKNELTDAFLRDINKYDILTPTEEKNLFINRDCARAAIKSAQQSIKKMEDSLKASIDMANEIINDKDMPSEVIDAANARIAACNEQLREYRAAVRETIAKNEKILDDAKKTAMATNQRFVFAVAKRYDNTERVMELVNEANLGLAEAFETYDVNHGNRFLAHAVWYIRRAINYYLLNKDVLVRPTNNVKVTPKIKKINNMFFSENGRYPSTEELIDLLRDAGVEIKNADDILGVKVDYIDSSISADDDDCTFENSRAFNEATAIDNEYDTVSEQEDLSNKATAALKLLSERERKIVTMSTGIGYSKEYSNKEIAEVLGLTAERVRQIRTAALEKMKAVYTQSR